MNASARIALVGSPNSGKTTLFNALTGSHQKTGNYAGVTVEKKEGFVKTPDGFVFSLLDLPGTYSLDARTIDESITAEIVKGMTSDSQHTRSNHLANEQIPEAVIAVADVTNLERNLYLVLQLKELGIPMLLALTMSDLAKKHGFHVRLEELQNQLGIPVILISAPKKSGLDSLLKQVVSLIAEPRLVPELKSETTVQNSQQKTPDKIIQRYIQIEQILKTAIYKKELSRNATKTIDRIVLHPVAGPIILFVVLALMFQAIFSLAETPKEWIESGVSFFQSFLKNQIPSGSFQSLVCDGIIAGVGSVLVFLPQILILFAFILFFEDSGYMARAAFILDRLMKLVGLNGRAFIPLLSSFACAIPGIMATRTIESRRDRLITILISPLITCSARIPIYTLLIAAFIPTKYIFGVFSLQGLVMFSFYFFGIIMAITMALILKKTVLSHKSGSFFVMELPTYKMPALRNILLGLWERTKIFIRKAGTIILLVSIILWVLSSFPKAQPKPDMDAKQVAAYQLENSFAGRIGKSIEPLIHPLGYNWKIGVGLLSSFAAREVIVSTLSTVYAVENSETQGESDSLTKRLRNDFNLPTALSLLVFYALACQCISTLAVTRRETNSWRWPAFMFFYMTSLAYGGAFITYKIALWLLL